MQEDWKPRSVLIGKSRRKNDRLDAKALARIDPQLLSPTSMHDHKTTADSRVEQPGGFNVFRVVDVPSCNAASILDNLGARFIYRTQGSKAA
jgi:hypothetical protein